MITDPNRDIGETRAFAFDVLVGVGGLIGVGHVGSKMGAFTDVAGTLPSTAIFGGVLLGASSVVVIESERFHTLFETPIVGIISATVMMCIVGGIVWTVSRAGPIQAIYTVLGIIAAALVTRICVFASRRTRSEGATQ